jgi:hypothetical protein
MSSTEKTTLYACAWADGPVAILNQLVMLPGLYSDVALSELLSEHLRETTTTLGVAVARNAAGEAVKVRYMTLGSTSMASNGQNTGDCLFRTLDGTGWSGHDSWTALIGSMAARQY